MKATLPLIMGLTLLGCANVSSLPGADAVRLIDAAEAQGCQRVGSANAQVADKIAFVERDEKKVAEELLALARNEAVKLGGDSLVIDGPIKFGSRRFVVYRCQS